MIFMPMFICPERGARNLVNYRLYTFSVIIWTEMRTGKIIRAIFCLRQGQDATRERERERERKKLTQLQSISAHTCPHSPLFAFFLFPFPPACQLPIAMDVEQPCHR